MDDKKKQDEFLREVLYFPVLIAALVAFTLYIRSCNPGG